MIRVFKKDIEIDKDLVMAEVEEYIVTNVKDGYEYDVVLHETSPVEKYEFAINNKKGQTVGSATVVIYEEDEQRVYEINLIDE